ncbi:MAG: hypothetical protein IJ461_09945 [Clostridia bacterium]|nr:hypothetical protein [Clostridia bacterium]
MAIWEDEQLKNRLEELALRSARRGRPMTTAFLTPPEAQLAQGIARKAGVEALFSAGYPGGERQLCCFCPQGEEAQFPIRCARITWPPKAQAPTHRDLLGALMALGMDRAMMGDLLVWPDQGLIFGLPQLFRTAVDGLSQAGNTQVTLTLLEEVPEIQPPADFEEVRDTVASLRLDNILASGMGTSRGKTLDWIAQGRVMVNHEPVQHADCRLRPGDLISIRGFGRLKIVQVGQPTRKDRLPIILHRFAGKN